jgi:HSP20 family protein
MAESTNVIQKERTEQAAPESTRGGIYFTPRVDIFENDQELTLFADVPGCGSEDIDLRFENGELLVHGKVPPRRKEGRKETGFVLQEYEVGDFYRAFTIHESIDSTRIEAECKNGVLIVHLPKVEAVRPRQIKVQAG